MIEGLWTLKFLRPTQEEVDLLSGVVVIETNRILGGDSGFLYIGQIGEKADNLWPVEVLVKKYDDRIEGFFSDADEYTLSGRMVRVEGSDDQLLLELGQEDKAEMLIALQKVAELP